ncbi:hypothetical protein GCM10027610_081560 [Dactylosporangium cerinum]
MQVDKTVSIRLIIKTDTKGIGNLTKLAPVVGGVIGGGINLTSTCAVCAWKELPGHGRRSRKHGHYS